MNKNHDFLDLANKKQFDSERVILSANVLNFCKHVETVSMQFVLTKSKVFLVVDNVIQRDILLEQIDALTVSTTSDEFIIHVREDSDERLSCQQNRSDIIQTMLYLMTYKIPPPTAPNDDKKPASTRKVKVYLVPDMSLDIYLTTDDDFDDGVVLRPEQEHLVNVNYTEYLKLEKEFLDEKEERRKSTRTIYSFSGMKPLTIDDFELIKTLGRGAHGKVLLCERRNCSGERYALKIIKKQHIIDANQFEHTLAEKIILSSLNHPFLVSLKYAFQTDEKIYFVMEFMKGGELFQHLRRYKSFSEEQTKFVAACIVLALGHLHNHNFIYRDLKPENVLMDDRGFAKLTDFGLAKHLDVSDVAFTFCGTPEYLAPEVILDKGCNRPADWWSLGILVYEMLYGLPPFYSKDVQEMYKKTILEPLKFKPRPNISDEAKDFIAGLLVKAPSKRLGSAADNLEVMNHAWFKDINWIKLMDRKLSPPFNPNDKDWEKNFDPGFIKEAPKDSICDINPDRLKEFKDKFKAFEFSLEEEPIMEAVGSNQDELQPRMDSKLSSSLGAKFKEVLKEDLQQQQKIENGQNDQTDRTESEKSKNKNGDSLPKAEKPDGGLSTAPEKDSKVVPESEAEVNGGTH